MKAFIQKHKSMVIIGGLVLVAILTAGIVLGIKSEPGKGPSQDADTQLDQGGPEQTPDDENDHNNGDSNNSGGIIVEDENGNSGNENEDNNDDAPPENPEDEEIKDIMGEIAGTEGDVVELSDLEIQWINNEIFAHEENAYWPNMFLICYYSCPEEIDLGEVFYMGLREHFDETEEEIAALEAAGMNLMFGEVSKMPVEKLEEILTKYTGYGVDFYKEQLDKEFYYLPEYEAYYTISSDVNYAHHEIESGYRTADGELVLFYRFNKNDTTSWICKATLKENEDQSIEESFVVISNEMYGLTSISYDDCQKEIADWETYDYIAKVDAVELESGKVTLRTYKVIGEGRELLYGNLSVDSIEKLELAEDAEIIVSSGMWNAYYLDHAVMERLQDSPCFADKEFFVMVKDGKIVKMIDRIGLRIWV